MPEKALERLTPERETAIRNSAGVVKPISFTWRAYCIVTKELLYEIEKLREERDALLTAITWLNDPAELQAQIRQSPEIEALVLKAQREVTELDDGLPPWD